jgi:ribosome-binding factor A
VTRGRPQKIADQIQRELSVLVSRELRDPRLGLVTLTAVDVAPDLSHALVYFTCLDAAQVEPAAGGAEVRGPDRG